MTSPVGSPHPVLGITMGDPAGIGPEIAVKALAAPMVRKAARAVVLGDARVIRDAARLAKVDLVVRPLTRIADASWAADLVEVLDLANADPRAFAIGRVSAVCGRAAYEYIERGVRLAVAGEIDAIVTAPVRSASFARSGDADWPDTRKCPDAPNRSMSSRDAVVRSKSTT